MIIAAYIAAGVIVFCFGLLAFGTGRFVDPGQGYDDEPS